jgi:GNAT superfamily N-acetyltransferase
MVELPIAATIRPARACEVRAILAMQKRALRRLGRAYYAAAQIEAFLEEVGTMDPALVEAGRCRVLVREGRVLASGAWAPRLTPGAGFAARRQAGSQAGVIQALYVDPDHARTGIGRAMVAQLEREIRSHGYGFAELEATMASVPFGTALGYWPGSPVMLGLAGGPVPFMGVVMAKPLLDAWPRLAA